MRCKPPGLEMDEGGVFPSQAGKGLPPEKGVARDSPVDGRLLVGEIPSGYRSSYEPEGEWDGVANGLTMGGAEVAGTGALRILSSRIPIKVLGFRCEGGG